MSGYKRDFETIGTCRAAEKELIELIEALE